MAEEKITVLMRNWEGGNWTQTATGWIWEGPTRITITDRNREMTGQQFYVVDAKFILKDSVPGGPSIAPEDDPTEPTHTSEESCGESVCSYEVSSPLSV